MSKKYISQYVIGEKMPNGRAIESVKPLEGNKAEFTFEDGSRWLISESTEVYESGFVAQYGGVCRRIDGADR